MIVFAKAVEETKLNFSRSNFFGDQEINTELALVLCFLGGMKQWRREGIFCEKKYKNSHNVVDLFIDKKDNGDFTINENLDVFHHCVTTHHKKAMLDMLKQETDKEVEPNLQFKKVKRMIETTPKAFVFCNLLFSGEVDINKSFFFMAFEKKMISDLINKMTTPNINPFSSTHKTIQIPAY